MAIASGLVLSSGLVSHGRGSAGPRRSRSESMIVVPPQDTFVLITNWTTQNKGKSFQICDRNGRSQYADSLPPTLLPGATEGPGLEFSVQLAQGRASPGLDLHASEPGAGRAVVRSLALREHKLVPVTPWYPQMNARTPGDSMFMFYAKFPNLCAFIPVRMRMDQVGRLQLAPDVDRSAGGLARLEVSHEDRQYYPELEHTLFRISLFRAATGAAFDPISLTPSTPLLIGRAYGRVEWKILEPPLRVHVPELHLARLEVTIAGRHGFVDSSAFHALGLPETGVDDWAPAVPRPPRRRFDRLIATVPVEGDTVRVVATMLYPRVGDQWPGSVDRVRILDSRGRLQFEDSLTTSLSPTGEIAGENDIAATHVRWSIGPGLRLDWTASPSDPSDPSTCRYFARRGSKLVAVTPWCSACEGPPQGDIVVSKTWQDWFTIRVPARVRLDRPEGGLELVPPRDANGARLAVFQIEDVNLNPRQFYGEDGSPLEGADAPLRVRLFKSPTGAELETVTITPGSRVKLGRVYAEVGLQGEAPEQYVQLKIIRLEVTIDGRHGYVEERDFHSVGLQQAG